MLFSFLKKKEKKTVQILSDRGLLASKTALRADLDAFFEAKQNEWNSSSNPDGKFPLNMAENNLNWEMMEAKLKEVSINARVSDWVSGYTGMRGDDEFLNVMSAFMTKYLTKVKIEPEHLAAAAGATAIIELISWLLCDEGDVAVIPAPSYPVYTQDLYTKAKVERFDLITHHGICDITHAHPLTTSHLDDTLKELQKAGKQFKMLLLTTPDNPTGHIYSADTLESIAKWCTDHHIHLVVNELYGLSRIDTSHPDITTDYSQVGEFQSFAQIMNDKKSDYLHMIYGLSKDFGMSGLRVGFLYSLNELMIKAFGNISAPHLISNYTQWALAQVFADHDFIADYIRTNQQKLTTSYVTVVNTLKEVNIPYVHAHGSLFVWLDMSEFMSENSEEEEAKLWQLIFDKTGVLLTPGIGFGHTKKGQFRLVHPYLSIEALGIAMNRLKAFILNQRSSS